MAFFETAGEGTAAESWILMYFEGSEGDSDFKIVKRSNAVCQVFLEDEETSDKLKGTIVAINESRDYIEANLETMKENYLKKFSKNPNVVPSHEKMEEGQGSSTTELEQPKCRDEEMQCDLEMEMLKEQEMLLKSKLDEMMVDYSAYSQTINFLSEQLSELPSYTKKVYTKVTVFYENNEKYVKFGPNGTSIKYYVYASMNWKKATSATRTLLRHVFGKEILATHSMTGKRSNAFKNSKNKVKSRLNPKKVQDIIELVCSKSSVEQRVVKSCITTKCADENKMSKKRLSNKHESNEEDVESRGSGSGSDSLSD